jgi:sulfur carrier protein
MNVTINGSPRDVPDDLTIRELVVHLGLGDGPVAVEVNREIVPRGEHATHKIGGGDTIEIVHFVGGG